MKLLWSIASFIGTVLGYIASVVILLEYIGIRPGRLVLKLPRWTLLVVSAAFFLFSVVSFQYSLYLVPYRAWLYLAVVLYVCALGVLWLLLSRSSREMDQKSKDTEASATLRLGSALASAEKVGALKVLAEEVDWLVSTLKAIFQWIDTNDKRTRPHLEHPLDESFRRHVGMNWGEGQDRLTSFQEAYKAHRSRISKHCSQLETELTRQDASRLRALNDKEFGDVLISHGGALRAEASRLLDVFQPLKNANPSS